MAGMDAGSLKILIIDDNRIRASILSEGLTEAGFSRVTTVEACVASLAEIMAADPDVIFIDLESPNRDRLESMLQMSRSLERPIAVFADQSDTATIEAAFDSGVSAYIVDGLKKERVKPILDITISRFNAFNRLKRELAEAKSELAERKVIDRAKGLLMKRKGIGEPEAYALLRRSAMNNNRKIVEVAQSLLVAADLLEDPS
jgi:two-component system, response regulator / RNA-binding antiterminator